jgi:hypothetical protein
MFKKNLTLALAGLWLLGLTACRSGPPLPPLNLSEPGWTLRRGEAVWRAKRSAPEVAGEILLATNPDGRTFVQFTKTPFPVIVAQSTPRSWQIEAPAQNRRYSGNGPPPARLIWFQLPQVASGIRPADPWTASRRAHEWRLENRSTGESLEGYFAP